MSVILIAALISSGLHHPPAQDGVRYGGKSNLSVESKGQPQASSQELAQAKSQGILAEELPTWLKWFRSSPDERNRKIDASKALFSDKQLQQFKSMGAKNGQPLCVNGDFELGDFTSWTTWTSPFVPGSFTWTQVITPPAPAYGNQLTSRHTILPAAPWTPFIPKVGYSGSSSPPDWNGPYDPIVNNAGGTSAHDIPIPMPGGGLHTLRLGNPTNGAQAEAAVTVFHVPPTMTYFTFQYAMVAEDPGHVTSHQPRFIYQLYDLGGSGVVDSVERVSSSTDPFFKSATINGRKIVWRRVSCYRKDISSLVGHDLMAVFINTDCSEGGHFGYTYVDSLCDQNVGNPILSVPDKICIKDHLIADGTQSLGVTTYGWTVVRCDANGNNEVASTKFTSTGTGAITTTTDITNLATQRQRPLKCGFYYKVSLTVATECSPETMVSKVVYVDCCNTTDTCCKDIKIGDAGELRLTHSVGTYGFSQQLVGVPTSTRSIDFDIVSASVANVGDKCPPAGPVYGYVSNAAAISVQNFSAPQFPANPYSHVVTWSSPGTTAVCNPTLPTTLTFPMPADPPCISYLRFCLRITVKTKDCKSCELLQWYYFKRVYQGEGQETVTTINPSQWPGPGSGPAGNPATKSKSNSYRNRGGAGNR